MLTAINADNRAAALDLIAAANSGSTQHCLHFARDPAGIESDIVSEEIDLGRGWRVLWRDGRPRAVCGVNCHEGRGWIYGPWSCDPDDAEGRRQVLDAVLELSENRVGRIDAYMDAPAAPVIAELEAAGFARYLCAHVMQAEPPAPPAAPTALEIGLFRPEQAEALAAIHADAFPDTYMGAPELIARGGPGVHLLTACAGGEVLGYLGMHPQLDGREAYIEFVGVRADRRGRGVGRALLDAALATAYGEDGVESVHLTVRDDRDSALRLYRNAGFALLYTGIGLKKLATTA